MIAPARLGLPSARRQLAELQRRDFALRHAAGALEFDSQTMAPPGNAAARSQTLGVLGEASLSLLTSAEGINLLNFLGENLDALTYEERRAVHLLNRSAEILRHVNMEEFLSFRRLAGETLAAWSRANSSGDFKQLEPWLSRLFCAARHIANETRPDTPPYEFWLDYNEEGLTEARTDELLRAMSDGLVPLLRRYSGCEPPDKSVFDRRVSPLYQQRIASAIMSALGVDRSRCRLAVSDHAFTVAFSCYDVRVCTRYVTDSFATSYFDVIHESGHALYELNTAPEYQYTRLGAGASVVVHEAQAKFYEDIIGRSLPWTEHIWPVLTENIPSLAEHTPREFYRAVNALRRTPLRSEADPLSYCLHILLRCEIERGILNGELEVSSAAALWNELTAKYLGCEVRNDAEGILQDPHWAAGQFGYFPAYALGAAAAAQLAAKMGEETDIAGCAVSGDFAAVNGWLRGHIWRHGAAYPPRELWERALGGPLDVKYYVNYISDRLSDVYGE